MSKSLADNTKYNKFVTARNKALEILHMKSLTSITTAMDEIIEAIRMMVVYRYPQLKKEGVYSPAGKAVKDRLESDIGRILNHLTPFIEQEMVKLRRMAYLLSYSSEAEAIGQATGDVKNYTLTKDIIRDKEQQETFTGGKIADRVQYITNKLGRKIIQAMELSAVNEADEDDMLDRLDRALPTRKTVKRPKKQLSVGPSLKEAIGEIPDDMSFGYMDDETWDEMVDVYRDQYIPPWRSDQVAYTIDRTAKAKEVEEAIYVWEVEQELTQDFVYQVRQGQIDAAKENGINDYVWVAIVDSRTDDCCIWRDGLTTSEIEKQLKGKRRTDHCQALVPPAHFNCRCVLAPMVDEMPDRPKSNAKDFDTWLRT